MRRRLFNRRPADPKRGSQHPAPASPIGPPASARCVLERYRGVADRIVVVDTETTGVFTTDRVLEVAVVTLDLAGNVIDEWDTLVDAGRDVGPTWLHGITASMLVGAPTFSEIAGELAARLDGAIVCAHNLPFDARMLTQEYARDDVEVTFTPGLDTLAATRCRLGVACEDAGIQIDGAHQALSDARATARLLMVVADQFSDALPTRFHDALPLTSPGRRMCREPEAAEIVAPPSFLAALAAKVVHRTDQASVASYLDLLDRAMADLQIDDDEHLALTTLARDLGLDDRDIQHAHRRWVDGLIGQATADGVVDDAEYDQLLRAAYALGVDAERVHDRTITERSDGTTVVLEPGLGLCFTGVALDIDGDEIPREELEGHARRLGLRVEETFTKKRCALLVAADTKTRSGKASKARDWGIPIVGATEFLAAERGGTVTCDQVTVGGRQAVRCESCGAVFTRERRQGAKSHCQDCAAPARSAPGGSIAPSKPKPPSVVPAKDEVLTCEQCGEDFMRPRSRGRKPQRCPSCRTESPWVW